MADLNLNRAEFILSAANPGQFVMNNLPKIAFAGRSNVGKSSVINRLLNRKQFAKVGATPGKTVHVNYFLIDGKLYFVDLPGYGYAKVGREERRRWAGLMERFFRDAGTFDCGVLIVDARHKPTSDDVQMAEYFRQSGHRFAVAANKTDKLKNSEREKAFELIQSTLQLEETVPLIPFSAEKGEGRDLLLGFIMNGL